MRQRSTKRNAREKESIQRIPTRPVKIHREPDRADRDVARRDRL